VSSVRSLRCNVVEGVLSCEIVTITILAEYVATCILVANGVRDLLQDDATCRGSMYAIPGRFPTPPLRDPVVGPFQSRYIIDRSRSPHDTVYGFNHRSLVSQLGEN
jgi:hypothetical protein